MTATETSLQARADAALAGGCTHVARSYRPALHVARAVGSRKWTVDGAELVDYTMGHGALLLGHAHPEVTAAVREQAERGTHMGAGHPLEIEWAERIIALVPSVERVRFTSSGTEATLLALRLARAATGRDVIVTLDDHFHGWHDAVVVGRGATPRGVPGSVAALSRVIEPGDDNAAAWALRERDVAAVILEASGAHYGRTALPAGFLQRLRDLCDATGTLLVVDEVVTGFRVARGGIQEVLGVRPDLTTFAKILAGGLPGGAVGGRADVMALLGSSDLAADPIVRHPGTYNANPLSASAGVTALRIVAETDAISVAAARAEELELAWRDRLHATGVAGEVWRLASIVHSAYVDQGVADRLGALLRVAGVDLFHTSAFVSTAHTEADIELTVSALDATLPRAARGD